MPEIHWVSTEGGVKLQQRYTNELQTPLHSAFPNIDPLTDNSVLLSYKESLTCCNNLLASHNASTMIVLEITIL